MKAIEGYSKEETQKFDTYLDDLRASGATNMFGAGLYLVRDFNLSKVEAHKILGEWMKQFGR